MTATVTESRKAQKRVKISLFLHGGVTDVGAGNQMQVGWRYTLLFPWHRQSAIEESGNNEVEEVSEERVWAELARRARKRWTRDNPY